MSHALIFFIIQAFSNNQSLFACVWYAIAFKRIYSNMEMLLLSSFFIIHCSKYLLNVLLMQARVTVIETHSCYWLHNVKVKDTALKSDMLLLSFTL